MAVPSTIVLSVDAAGFTISRTATTETITLTPVEAAQVQAFLQSAAAVPQALTTNV